MKKNIFFSLLLAAVAMAFINPQTYLLKGKVTDDKGNPLVGVTVQIKRSNIGTTTNASGDFSISVTGKETLVFSYVGFNSKEVKVVNKKLINITLAPSQQALQEVVVVGYESAKMDVSIGYSSGSVGAAPGISLRGITSVSGNNYHNKSGKKYADTNADKDFNREGYDAIVENPFLTSKDNPLSTFSIDVDAASYSNVRRLLNSNQLPPNGAVRIEEMINYFSYQYPQPTNNDPFSVNMEVSSCPWNEKHKLVLIGLQGKKIAADNLPASNLVFLIDVSGSMMTEYKLPLVKASMKLLVDQLRPQDKVAMVVYAGSAGLVLPSTSGSNKIKIKEAIDELEAGGSTAGGEGIKLAYKTAKDNFIKGANNRVVLCTDGDFNVGVSSDSELEKLIEKERESGVFLTVLGYGTGNYQDAKMQKLADKGNGNHGYIDNLSEAKKMLVKEFGGTIFTIAKDVKLQIEFNPSQVQGYRLIGYENRMLAKEDFNDDTKDAGEMGSGHTVTALYEVIPVGVKSDELKNVDKLRYQSETEAYSETDFTKETMYVKLRYKQPDGNTSKLLEFPLDDVNTSINKTSENFRFAAAVAAFGMLLRDSKYKGNINFNYVHELANKAIGKDEEGYRKEFVTLIEKAAKLKGDVGLRK